TPDAHTVVENDDPARAGEGAGGQALERVVVARVPVAGHVGWHRDARTELAPEHVLAARVDVRSRAAHAHEVRVAGEEKGARQVAAAALVEVALQGDLGGSDPRLQREVVAERSLAEDPAGPGRLVGQ